MANALPLGHRKLVNPPPYPGGGTLGDSLDTSISISKTLSLINSLVGEVLNGPDLPSPCGRKFHISPRAPYFSLFPVTMLGLAQAQWKWSLRLSWPNLAVVQFDLKTLSLKKHNGKRTSLRRCCVQLCRL